MALKVNNVIYRSLEEQVRKNMEDISTEFESLTALTDKVNNFQPGGEKVSITVQAGTSSGTVTDEQLVKLQENEANYIEMVNDKEIYYLNDNGHVDGYLTYSHVGIENSKATIKTLTITVSTKSFVIVTTVVPADSGGGKLYQHYISILLRDVPAGEGPPLFSVDTTLVTNTSDAITTANDLWKWFGSSYNLFYASSTYSSEITGFPVVSIVFNNINNSRCEYLKGNAMVSKTIVEMIVNDTVNEV